MLDISPFYSSYYSRKYNMGAPSKIHQLAGGGGKKENKVECKRRVEKGVRSADRRATYEPHTSMFFITKIDLFFFFFFFFFLKNFFFFFLKKKRYY